MPEFQCKRKYANIKPQILTFETLQGHLKTENTDSTEQRRITKCTKESEEKIQPERNPASQANIGPGQIWVRSAHHNNNPVLNLRHTFIACWP